MDGFEDECGTHLLPPSRGRWRPTHIPPPPTLMAQVRCPDPLTRARSDPDRLDRIRPHLDQLSDDRGDGASQR